MTTLNRSQSRLVVYCLLSLVAFFSGCISVGLQKVSPDIKTYALDLSSQGHSAVVGKPLSVRLNGFCAVPAFADRYLTYRTGETVYEQDFYNQLLAAPSGMAYDQTLIWLKGSPQISFVLPMDSTVNPDRVIDGKLLELYGDYSQGKTPKAVLKIQFTVSGGDATHFQILFQKIYSAEIPMTRPSPKELTGGWNAGLGQILANFEKDLQN